MHLILWLQMSFIRCDYFSRIIHSAIEVVIPQLDTSSYLTCSAISATGAYLAFGNSEGTIHLMSQAEENTPFNGFEGQPVPWLMFPLHYQSSNGRIQRETSIISC
jgi:hypothetical protein